MDLARLEGGALIGFLPIQIWLNPDLAKAHAVLHVLGVMTLFAQGDRLAISQYDLAKRMGLARQSVSESMDKAEKLGLLQRLEIDGDVVWRMRWLSGFTRQAHPDAQRQAHPDSQAHPDATHAHAHALSPVLNLDVDVKETSTPRKRGPQPLTDEERQKLHGEFDTRLGNAANVETIIAQALNHTASKKWKGEYRGLQVWLRREARDWERHKEQMAAAKANKAAAEARARAAKGEPVHDPKVSEPAPFITKTVFEIMDEQPYRNRQND